jgi:hypothetical protein
MAIWKGLREELKVLGKIGLAISFTFAHFDLVLR